MSRALTGTERRAWLRHATVRFAEQMETKYLSGAAEHGGDLGDVPTSRLIEHIIEEALDTALYTAEMRRRSNPIPASHLQNGTEYLVRSDDLAGQGVLSQWAVLMWNAAGHRFQDANGTVLIDGERATAFYLPS